MDIGDIKAQDIIKQFSIPAKPEVLIALQQELDKSDPDPQDYADVISRDVALAALVLKTINSPMFGLKREISDIRQAVVLLGTDKLAPLLTYFALRSSIKGKAAISLEKFWDNTMEVATMSNLVISQLSHRCDVDDDQLYALGLFRDCGIPLMAMKYGNYREVLFEANHSPHHSFTEIEDGHYQTNHAIIGYFVASSWHLPKSLHELILRHHDPNFLNDKRISREQKDLYGLNNIASAAATRYKYGKTDSEWPMVKESVLTHFGLSDLDFNDLMADLQDEYDAQFGEL